MQSAAEAWLLNLETRKRKPAKAATLQTFRSYLKNHIEPFLGEFAVEWVSNATLREFVAHLSTKNLSPKTINEIVSATKAVISSCVDPETGESLYVRKWNSVFIDAPIIEKQNQPIVSVQDLEDALSVRNEFDRSLWALAAGSGARIGELLALRIGLSDVSSYWNPADATLSIKTSIWAGREQSPKTENSLRTVELDEALNDLLKAFVGSRSGGFLFGNGQQPANVSTMRLHLDKYLPGKGFHSLRRFRVTVLRGAGCKEDLLRYWIGHSSGSITDLYSKLSSDVTFRRAEANRCGLGFKLRQSREA
jgi:integrase